MKPEERDAAIDYGRLFATVTEELPVLITELERIVGDREKGAGS